MRLIKYALDNDLNRSAIIYLLEGNIPTNAINGISLSALQSACVNMQVRDGFRIYHTLDPVTFINKISNCLTKYGCYQDRITYNVEDNIIQSKVAVKKEKEYDTRKCLYKSINDNPRSIIDESEGDKRKI